MKHNQWFIASSAASFWRSKTAGVAVLFVSLVFMIPCILARADTLTVSLVTDSTMAPAARHGIEKVRAALALIIVSFSQEDKS